MRSFGTFKATTYRRFRKFDLRATLTGSTSCGNDLVVHCSCARASDELVHGFDHGNTSACTHQNHDSRARISEWTVSTAMLKCFAGTSERRPRRRATNPVSCNAREIARICFGVRQSDDGPQCNSMDGSVTLSWGYKALR